MNNIFLFKIIKVDHLWLLCMLQGVAFLHYVCLSFFWFTWLYASPATTIPVVPKQENDISIWKNIKMYNKNSRWKSRMKNIFKTKSSEFSTIFILIQPTNVKSASPYQAMNGFRPLDHLLIYQMLFKLTKGWNEPDMLSFVVPNYLYKVINPCNIDLSGEIVRLVIRPQSPPLAPCQHIVYSFVTLQYWGSISNLSLNNAVIILSHLSRINTADEF